MLHTMQIILPFSTFQKEKYILLSFFFSKINAKNITICLQCASAFLKNNRNRPHIGEQRPAKETKHERANSRANTSIAPVFCWRVVLNVERQPADSIDRKTKTKQNSQPSRRRRTVAVAAVGAARGAVRATSVVVAVVGAVAVAAVAAAAVLAARAAAAVAGAVP